MHKKTEKNLKNKTKEDSSKYFNICYYYYYYIIIIIIYKYNE